MLWRRMASRRGKHSAHCHSLLLYTHTPRESMRGRTGQLSSRRQVTSRRSMRGTSGATAPRGTLAASSPTHAHAASRTVWLLVRAQRA